MIGAPGSGKSTYLSKNFPFATCVSNDGIREELYGDASIQGNWTEIEARMVELIKRAASLGQDVVVDNTHYLREYRKGTMAILKKEGYGKITAVVLDKPLETCLRQNSNRDRKVPEEVIKKMHSSLRQSIKGIASEGFCKVDYLSY